jgi:RimJ/RimL family protein N-acetyltransferase
MVPSAAISDRPAESSPGTGGARFEQKRGPVRRILRGVVWRIIWLTHIHVFRAISPKENGGNPAGFQLLRLQTGNDPQPAEDAMIAAGEAPGLAAERLQRGDQFFAWQQAGKVVCFGWVTYKQRQIGVVTFAPHPGRAYLYNFHTLQDFRGRTLYPQLLKAITSQLTLEQRHDVIIDVNSRNRASLRGIEKAGFHLVGRISWLTLLRHWNLTLSRIRLDDVPPIN